MPANIFNTVIGNKPKSSLLDLSHERKQSFNMGDLVPIFSEDVVPGDRFKVSSEVMLRLAPMLAPIMHRVNVYTHYFFVPYRLVWDDWKDFITGGVNGLIEPAFPKFSSSNLYFQLETQNGSLWDYLGNAPVPNGNVPDMGALVPRAYQLIYNEYYRDENLIPPIDFSTESGTITDNDEIARLLRLRKRCWEKDYFTGALPWTQKGEEASISLGDTAPILYDNDADTVLKRQDDGTVTSGDATVQAFTGNDNGRLVGGGTNEYLNVDNHQNLTADLSEASAVTINQLRTAVKLQEFLERNARGGSRYIEQIYSHFGVKSSDARLQRPEFLGGGKSPVMISEVLQTSEGTTESAQGTMAGHGFSVGNNHAFNRRFEEHGIVLGIMSVMPKTSYQQGIRRYYSKTDKFDFYWPSFAHLGEQEVYNWELNSRGSNGLGTFGYNPRYAEYKYIPSTVHGDFKSSLNYWHMGRILSDTAQPELSEDFVKSDPTHRIFAVETESAHKLWAQIYNNVKAVRPMPKFNNPSL